MPEPSTSKNLEDYALERLATSPLRVAARRCPYCDLNINACRCLEPLDESPKPITNS